MMRHQFLAVCTGLLILFSQSALAFGVAVSPTAVLLDTKTLFGHIELSNTSSQPRMFAVEYEDAALADCFRVSPRSINIAAGQTQVVRFQFTCAAEKMPAAPMVFLMEQQQNSQLLAVNQLDFRLRLGLKVRLQTNPVQSLF